MRIHVHVFTVEVMFSVRDELRSKARFKISAQLRMMERKSCCFRDECKI